MRVTARDVARHAGVAASTVSRALNEPGRINEQTRQRVLDAARELGYHAVPRTPERKGLVALLVPDVTNPFYFDIIRSTQEQLRTAGYMQLVIDTTESGRTEAEVLRQLHGVVDGAILSATRLEPEALSEVAAVLPVSVINRRLHEVPSVLIDIRAGLIQAIEHLRALGHRRIAFVSGPPESWQNRWRWKEFEEQVKGQDMEPLLVGPYPPNLVGGAAAADALLASPATACLAFNDLLSIGILQRLRSRGVKVPDRLSVIGCDNIFGSDFCDPPLTTIAGDAQQAGRIAATQLVGLLADQTWASSHASLVPTHLLVRESTGPAPRQSVTA